MTGTVLNTTAKTVKVEIIKHKKVRVYGKMVKYRIRYLAHDAKQVCNKGDVVTIQECRPISRHKHFEVVSVDVAQAAA